MLDGTLTLQIDEGSGFTTWTEVDDLYSSGPDDLHYTLDRATGTIGVGDGVHGHLPVANPQNPLANVVATGYRYGGGRAGNLGPDAITQLQSAVDGIAAVTNLFASEGGVDDETLTDAKNRAPQSLKTRDRAVTNDDFELLAQATPGATRADISALQSGSYSAWLDTQMAMPRSQGHVDWLLAKGYDGEAFRNNMQGLDPMLWRKFISSPDALRQRMVLALSELLVVSVLGINTAFRQFAIANYLDVLDANAFGNFRTLLEQVTLTTAMGHFLTYRGNAKANAVTGSH